MARVIQPQTVQMQQNQSPDIWGYLGMAMSSVAPFLPPQFGVPLSIGGSMLSGNYEQGIQQGMGAAFQHLFAPPMPQRPPDMSGQPWGELFAPPGMSPKYFHMS